VIVLASTSAVRARILTAAGVAFTAVSPNVDEAEAKTRLRGGSPAVIAEHLAQAKALAVSATGDDLVIGADQTLDLDGALIDKAADLTEARAHLMRLRGRRHTLHAAVALARGGRILWQGMSAPVLTMRAFSDAYLDRYLVECGPAVLSSVGCYHLEGRGAQLFEAVDGDYFAVLGLPLLGLMEALRQAGGLAS
jgi:septum formation protein